jgi:FKBP-type peptidyl-prolyl cis-trans isomerase
MLPTWLGTKRKRGENGGEKKKGDRPMAKSKAGARSGSSLAAALLSGAGGGEAPAKRRKTSSAKVPKTYGAKVVAAIRAIRSPTGASRAAIAKYLLKTWGVDNRSALKKALKSGEASGTLARDKQSFRVAGDAAYAPDPADVVEVVDVKVGTGEAATPGCDVTVKYKGTLQSTGAVFDAAPSFSFTLGAGDVIKGWDRGIEGMRVGGKRTLVVPPKLGYGNKGSGGKNDPGRIPPGATLCFTVTLRAVKS